APTFSVPPGSARALLTLRGRVVGARPSTKGRHMRERRYWTMPIERRALVKAVAILCITGGLAALTSAASAGPPTTPSPYGCPWGVLSGYNVGDVCQQTVDNRTAPAD